jgi:FkbM family methyltransferase
MKHAFQKLLSKSGFSLIKTKTAQYLVDLPESLHNQIISNSKGVLHIGAHLAEERFKYELVGVPVIWIEGIPEYHSQLLKILEPFPNQSAWCYFLSDSSEAEVPFYLASNDCASSSLFQLSEKNGFPGLVMDHQIVVETHRMDKIVDPEFFLKYEHVVIDVQGAELKVLLGFGDLLYSVQSMKLEVSTYEVYKGGATYLEIKQYLDNFGFFPLWEPPKHSHTDIIFIRKV